MYPGLKSAYMKIYVQKYKTNIFAIEIASESDGIPPVAMTAAIFQRTSAGAQQTPIHAIWLRRKQKPLSRS